MAAAVLSIKVESGRKCIAVPIGHALIGDVGIFLREIELPVGATVVVQFSRGREEIPVRGTVSTCFAHLGLCVRFRRHVRNDTPKARRLRRNGVIRGEMTMSRIRGSVIRFDKRRLCGCILGEDGRKVLFDKTSLEGLNTRLLSLGDKVEFQEHTVGVFRARKIRFTLCFTGSFENCAGSQKLGRNESPQRMRRGTR